MKPYTKDLKVWKEDNSTDRTSKGKQYKPFKKAARQAARKQANEDSGSE